MKNKLLSTIPEDSGDGRKRVKNRDPRVRAAWVEIRPRVLAPWIRTQTLCIVGSSSAYCMLGDITVR